MEVFLQYVTNVFLQGFITLIVKALTLFLLEFLSPIKKINQAKIFLV